MAVRFLGSEGLGLGVVTMSEPVRVVAVLSGVACLCKRLEERNAEAVTPDLSNPSAPLLWCQPIVYDPLEAAALKIAAALSGESLPLNLSEPTPTPRKPQ